jgi:hypothetical protein
MKPKPQSLPKFGLRPGEAAFALGSAKILEECVAGGWITAVIQRHKLVLYDAGDVARCWARILAGEVPQPRTTTSKGRRDSSVTSGAPKSPGHGTEQFPTTSPPAVCPTEAKQTRHTQ